MRTAQLHRRDDAAGIVESPIAADSSLTASSIVPRLSFLIAAVFK